MTIVDEFLVAQGLAPAEETDVEGFLAHFGVKGMKWKNVKAHPDVPVQNINVKNQPNTSGFNTTAPRPKPGQVAHDPKTPKADVDWAQKKATAENLTKVATKSHNEFQNKFKELMKEPRFQEVAALIKARKNDPQDAQNPKVIAFFKQAKKIHDDIWAKNSKETFGQSPSKGYDLVAVHHPDGTVTSSMVKTKATLKPVGKSGKNIPTAIRHEEILREFLEHQGVTSQVVAPATQAAIMAVPSALDPIRLVGDEEKHVTLLYFGETSTLPDGAQNTLLDVIAQVAKMTSPFRESIIETSRLGNEIPPALVAKMSGRYLEQIRNSLMVSPQIRDYMKNGTQYPQFTPHVTLAYPDYTGETEIRDMLRPLYRVNFDRLSLWWNDERFDISLVNNVPPMDDSENCEAAWSDEVSDFLEHFGIVKEPEIRQDDVVGNFLAHFGIKGMRWGIRRERGPGGTVESGVKLHEDNSFEIPSLHKMPVGSVAAIHTGEASPKLMKKREDGRWEETHLSADAERFAKTRAKAQHELSDREIKEATARAEAIKKYNDLFNPAHDANKELKDKVEAMELQLRYAKAHSTLHPSFGTRVSRFVKSNEKLFASAVGALSGPTGKKLVDYIKKELEPGISAVKADSSTVHPKQSTDKGTSVAKQTATLPFSGNGPHSNPSHVTSTPKKGLFRRKPKETPFDPKAFK